MGTAPNGDGPALKAEQERERIRRAAKNGDIAESDADLILELLDALDPGDYATDPGDIGTKSQSTIAIYGQNLRLLAIAARDTLEDMDTVAVNQTFSDMDVAQNTLSQRQATARIFYRYHGTLDVDPEAIAIVGPDQTPVEPRDLFSKSEIDAMRHEIDNARDLAMFDLMVYTGQRIRAVQTLRVKDIELTEKRFYLNTDEAGLKGAKGIRPLLLAHGACREWMDYHPASDDPDAYFITKLPDSNRGDVHSQLYQSTINRRIESVAEAAGIDRWKDRAHAHNLRHTFVRWAYINRGMDIQTIKYMTGHAKDSQTLEQTYMNILDTDFARKAEEAAGVKSVDEPEDLLPEVCPTCEFAPIPEGSRMCPRCATPFDTEGVQAQKSVQQDIGAERALADGEHFTEADLEAIAEDDELLAEFIKVRTLKQTDRV